MHRLALDNGARHDPVAVTECVVLDRIALRRAVERLIFFVLIAFIFFAVQQLLNGLLHFFVLRLENALAFRHRAVRCKPAHHLRGLAVLVHHGLAHAGNLVQR